MAARRERRIGIVDLGSNTARLVVFAYRRGLSFRLVDSIREPVRLAEGLGPSGRLRQAAIRRAVAVLEMFADFARAAKLHSIRVVATSAVRDATNNHQILDCLERLQLPHQVLSGAQEARLGVLAVANSFAVRDAWVVDQGGGSAQVSLMRHRGFKQGGAYPLGALRLAERFLAGGGQPVRSRQIRELEGELENCLGSTLDQALQTPYELIALGGNIRSLAALAQAEEGYPIDLLHGYCLRADAVEMLTDRLLGMSAVQRRNLPGISADRAEIIAAAAITFRWLLRRSQRQHLLISGRGVREGSFLERFLPRPHRIADLRRWSVENLLAQYPQPGPHTRRVEQLALALFDELQKLHKLSPIDRELLRAAARLHDIGTAVDYYRHHQHGAFLLLQSGLDGFRHEEIALIAQVIRYHRKGMPRVDALSPILKREDQKRLGVLTTCLRLAEHLERSRSGRIHGLRAAITPRQVTLILRSRAAPSVEMWEAAKDAPLFEKAFARQLRFRHAVGLTG